jgi:hypothetical protein
MRSAGEDDCNGCVFAKGRKQRPEMRETVEEFVRQQFPSESADKQEALAGCVGGGQMKICNGCKFAEWKKTKGGKLHPSGDGNCKFKIVLPKLPACKNWIGHTAIYTVEGIINRKALFSDHCPYYCGGRK